MLIKPLEFEMDVFSEIQAAIPMPGVVYNVKQTQTGWAWRCNSKFFADAVTEESAKLLCFQDWHDKINQAITDDWQPAETIIDDEVEEIPFFIRITNDLKEDICLQVSWFEGYLWPCHLGTAVTHSDKIDKRQIKGWKPC